MITPAPAATSGTPALQLTAAAITDVGNRREHNEDDLLVLDGILYAVADGLGGHADGEVAAEITIETLTAAFMDQNGPVDPDMVDEAIHLANHMVRETAWLSGCDNDMGSTLVALSVGEAADGTPLFTAHNIGDSRCYLLRDGELTQVTEDDTPVAKRFRKGLITKAEAWSAWDSNVIDRAIGIDQIAVVTRTTIVPEVGDRFVLCSDGLNGELRDERIEHVLLTTPGAAAAAAELVAQALQSGGNDNVTVIVIDVTAKSAG